MENGSRINLSGPASPRLTALNSQRPLETDGNKQSSTPLIKPGNSSTSLFLAGSGVQPPSIPNMCLTLGANMKEPPQAPKPPAAGLVEQILISADEAVRKEPHQHPLNILRNDLKAARQHNNLNNELAEKIYNIMKKIGYNEVSSQDFILFSVIIAGLKHKEASLLNDCFTQIKKIENKVDRNSYAKCYFSSCSNSVNRATPLHSLISAYIEDKQIQEGIAEVIDSGIFISNPIVLKELINHIGSMRQINPDVQIKIAQAIYSTKFGEDSSVLKLLVITIGRINFTNEAAQREIGYAICDSKFTQDSRVLKALITSFREFRFIASIQQYIAQAIKDGKFTQKPEILEILAISLGQLGFTDEIAQRSIATAIKDGKFTENPSIMKALAISLASMNFTYSAAQVLLAESINEGRFTQNPSVLKSLAVSLGNINFTEPYAQVLIASAISECKLTQDSETLIALATSLGKMNFTAPIAQRLIAEAISNGVFTQDSSVLKALTASFAVMKFTDPLAQQLIAEAIFKGKFSQDLEVFKILASSLATMSFFDLNAQRLIITAINNSAFKQNLSIRALLRNSISNWVITDEELQQELSKIFPESYFFGRIIDFSSAVLPESIALNSTSEINIEYTAIHNGDSCGSYGVIYAADNNPKWLIVYVDKVSEGNSQKQIIGQMLGFLRINEVEAPYYQGNISKLKVYDLTRIDGGYPTLLNELGPQAVEFERLPIWLKQTILRVNFSPCDYEQTAIMEYGLTIANILDGPILKPIVISTIQRIILNQGERLQISNNAEDDKKIKEDINIAFNNSINEEAFQSLNEFYDTLTKEQKLKLIFLLGHIAKDGALGYHHGNENQANQLYYDFCKRCAEKLQHEDSAIPGINNLITALQGGQCIGAAMHNFAWVNPSVFSIWDRKNPINEQPGAI